MSSLLLPAMERIQPGTLSKCITPMIHSALDCPQPLKILVLGPYYLPFSWHYGPQIPIRFTHYVLLTSILGLLQNETLNSSIFFAQTSSKGVRIMHSGVAIPQRQFSLSLFTLFMKAHVYMNSGTEVLQYTYMEGSGHVWEVIFSFNQEFKGLNSGCKTCVASSLIC